MIALVDESEVMERHYHYLLDFNKHDNWQIIFKKFGKKRLSDLNRIEFWQLFQIASSLDFVNKDKLTINFKNK